MNGRGAKRVLVAMLLAAGTASGQNAHGDGRAKDANQRVGSGGYNSPVRADFSAAASLRSAIVTGNAPGGLSFRGDVGYAAPREFRGELGSDDLFTFRRDSLYSGLSGLGIRGTDALQYQFALTTGNSPPPSLAGTLTLPRDGRDAGAAAAGVRSLTDAADNSAATIARVDPARLADLSGTGLWKMRSSAGYVTDRSIAESIVGGYETEEGDGYGITASPLGGIRSYPVSPNSAQQRDPSSTRSDGSSPTGQPLTADTAADVMSLSAYDRLVEGVQDSYAQRSGQGIEGVGGVTQMVEDQNRKLREFLESVRAEGQAFDGPEGVSPGDAPPAGEAATDVDERVPATERLIRQLEDLGVQRGAIDAMRESEIRLDELLDPTRDVGRDFYAMHMSQGRDLMESGRFFEAEARFSMALSVREGDPTASIARVHAQIGAGLFLSASLNLRETFTANPMLIAARYAPELMPSPARLRSVIDRLNARIDGEGSEARAAALLLAYIGRHTGDENLIRRGLGRLDIDGPDRMAQLLRLVWLDDADVQRSLELLGESIEPAGGDSGE